MHDLVSRLDQSEDQLRGVTKRMKDCTAEALGSSALDGAVGDLAGRMGDKIDELGKSVEAVLERLKACVRTYEEVDHGWQQAFGGSGGAAGGAAAGAAAGADAAAGAAGAAAGAAAGGAISDALDGGGAVQPAPDVSGN